LLAIERYARLGDYDFVVLDCAPTDSTLRLVSLPDVAHGALRLLLRLQRSLSSIVTPLARSVVPVPLPSASVFREAENLLYKKLHALRKRLLSNETSVRLVMTPERMVIDEARRAYTDLCLFALGCDAVVLNRMLPEAAAEEEFFRDWWHTQAQRRLEVEAAFAPLPVLEAPLQDDEVTGVERLAHHGRTLFADRDPVARLAAGPRPRFARDGAGYRLELPLPGADLASLDVAKIEDELVVRAGAVRRAIKLPRRVAALDVQGARLADGWLEVSFAPEAAPEPLA
jgi:arsenite-transporting ATPase